MESAGKPLSRPQEEIPVRVQLISTNMERHPWPVPPIGACYTASSLSDAGHDVDLIDLCWCDPTSALEDRIGFFHPDLIGLSIRNIDNVDLHSPRFYLNRIRTEVVELIRNCCSAPVVLGGSAVSVMPLQILDYMGADFAIGGEGEESLPQLIEALEGARGIKDVEGLVHRSVDGLIFNPSARVGDVNGLPRPRIYHWIDWRRYAREYAPYPVQTKRGCALQCSYCVYNRIEGSAYRLRDPVDVADEVEEIVRCCEPQVIEFTDSTFNIPLRHALDVCRELTDRDLDVSFNTMGVNPGSVTGELVEMMRSAGFMEISCTPESGSDKMLRSLDKNFSVKDVANASRHLKGSGIPVIWYFLFGSPGETEETVGETFDFIEGNISSRDLVFITSGIRILPGSPLYDQAVAEGQLHPRESVLEPVWYRPAGIDLERMKYMIDREVISHPNFINLSDNTDDTLLARALKRIYSILRIREPVWTNIMRRNILKKVFLLDRYELRRLEGRSRRGE
jgi:radical SAM superfamily enzyme YgiQ (UPF0313 family)